MVNSRGGRAQDDDAVMARVELALAQPPGRREAFIQNACGDDSELLAQVRNYVHWEEAMDRFLLDPIYVPAPVEYRFEAGECLAGRFRIVHLVAEGGMGVVYEAWDEKLERRIAVKCAKAGFDKRLPPEVRHASEISHPNVCKIYEIHSASTAHGEIDFFTMEFLEGETLADRLRRGRLPAPAARKFGRQISAGLAEAHRHGVIHGDLKTNNVILATDAAAAGGKEESVRAVITDFGLARGPAATAPLGNLQSAEAGGAPDYMAPELWTGQKVSGASDVYALGVILYELESGRRPFGLDVPLEHRAMLRPPHLHAKWGGIKLDPVLARCLDPAPARRFRDAGEVAKVLQPVRPLPWWLLAAAAFVAIVVGVVTYQGAIAPKDSWRLAMQSVEPSSSGMAGDALALSRDAAAELSQLKGGDVARLSFIPPAKADSGADATYILKTGLGGQNGKAILYAVLIDARSKVNVREWTAEYAPEELSRYAPVALAGMVRAALHLPPRAVRSVNTAAAKDYWAGVWDTRQSSTLDEAISLLQRAVAEDPGSPLPYASLAEAQWFESRVTRDVSWLDRANESVRQAERRNPDVAGVHRALGYLQYSKGRYAPARAELERAIQLEPGNANAYILLGKAYEDDGQLTPALTAFQKAAEVEPGYPRVYQNLGAYFVNRSDFSKGAEYHKKAVDLAPYEPSLHSNLAAAYGLLGRFDEALSEDRRSLDLAKTRTAEHNLGQALMYRGSWAEAAEHFQNALMLGSPQGGAPPYLTLMYLGIANRNLGHKGDSLKNCQQGLKMAEEGQLNPRYGYEKAFLGYFKAACGNRQDAEDDIGEALGLATDESDTRWRAVLTYEELYRRYNDHVYRDKTLAVLKESTPEQVDDVNRWQDLDNLHKDPAFQKLFLEKHQVK
ncbi:MAG TPA: protein kinase [Bryobacteraceae bacterium]|jgi:serine/threonine protein kinase